jgi:hypothetical protein
MVFDLKLNLLVCFFEMNDFLTGIKKITDLLTIK